MRGNKRISIVDNELRPAEDDEPLILIYCMTCKYWQASLNPAFGHCLLAGKSSHGPFPTTDLTTCTRAERK